MSPAPRSPRRTAVACAAGLLMLGALALAPSPPSAADAPNVVSAHGITVHGWRWITGRTLEVDISTVNVGAGPVVAPHRVRITLPTNYFQAPTTRFPVLYLLHGGAGANSSQWTTGGGAVEQITNGRALITVMPDGGKVGWYTNWLDQTGGPQRWADYHLNQLIAWTDANLRTNATKQGRAIAGLSMGGFGAIRYAQDRPDLFAYAASFSGALDLGDAGIRATVTQQSMQYGLPAYGAFGSPFWPNDGVWNALNPLNRASRLHGVSVALYAGSGIHDADVLERTVGAATDRMHHALNAAGVPHFYWMYGRPGPSVPYGCDGGHNFSCWNFALNDVMPRMMAVLQSGPTPPPPGNAVANAGFETAGLAPWACAGNCGVDRGAGLSRTGVGNGWVRNTSGWNDIHQTIAVAANTNYVVTGWVRTSTTSDNSYFGLRTTGGTVRGEQRFGSLGGYTRLSVNVYSGPNTQLVVFAGMWASNRDTWIQVDDISVTRA